MFEKQPYSQYISIKAIESVKKTNLWNLIMVWDVTKQRISLWQNIHFMIDFLKWKMQISIIFENFGLLLFLALSRLSVYNWWFFLYLHILWTFKAQLDWIIELKTDIKAGPKSICQFHNLWTFFLLQSHHKYGLVKSLCHYVESFD